MGRACADGDSNSAMPEAAAWPTLPQDLVKQDLLVIFFNIKDEEAVVLVVVVVVGGWWLVGTDAFTSQVMLCQDPPLLEQVLS